MSEASPPGPNKPHWTVFSVVLLISGLLILIPSGLCTVLFDGSIAIEGDLSGILIVLISGGVQIAIGAVLVWAAFKARIRE